MRGAVAGMLREIASAAMESMEVVARGLRRGELGEGEVRLLYENSVKTQMLRGEASLAVLEAIARYKPVGRELRAYSFYLMLAYDLHRIARYCWEIGRLFEVFGGLRDEGASSLVDRAREGLSRLVESSLSGGLEEGLAQRLAELERESDSAYLDMLRGYARAESLGPRDVARALVLRHIERMLDHVEYIAEGARQGL